MIVAVVSVDRIYHLVRAGRPKGKSIWLVQARLSCFRGRAGSQPLRDPSLSVQEVKLPSHGPYFSSKSRPFAVDQHQERRMFSQIDRVNRVYPWARHSGEHQDNSKTETLHNRSRKVER